jgi:AraC-like DNA-binding protein/quercetin dioxygenase-like cupin family protein
VHGARGLRRRQRPPVPVSGARRGTPSRSHSQFVQDFTPRTHVLFYSKMAGSSRLVNSGACFESAALVVWGPGSVSKRHSHACAQLTVALTGALRVRERAHGPWRSCRAVVVKAGADHEIDARGALALIGFIDAKSTLGAAVTPRVRSAIGIVSRAEAARWRLVLGDPETLDAARVKRWLATTLMRDAPRTRVHPAVEQVMRMLQDQPLDTRTTSLVHLSTIAGLSPSRFAHVFTESMGTPLRPFMRWLRLRRAARELVSGRSATHAAHVAGFADSAHLTRTFRRMLGGTPRILIRRGDSHSANAARRMRAGVPQW